MNSFFRGFMVDQRENGLQERMSNGELRKAHYPIMHAGTNGVPSSVTPVTAGTEAVAGAGVA